MYKLIALDVDGTLLNPEGQITPRVRAAIQAATEAGCIITLATGRRHRPARAIANDLGIKVPLILYSGTLIYDTAQEKALLHRPLERNFVAAALSFLRENGVSQAILQSPLHGERIYIPPGEDSDPYLRFYASRPDRADLIERRAHDQLLAVVDPLVITGVGPGHVEGRLLRRLGETGELDSNLYSYHLKNSLLPDLYGFDMLPPAHNKGYALAWLAHHYGFELAETLAIGDSHNDLDMLETAGLGLAMGNASPEVKARAKMVIGTNAEDAVAEAIERFVL